MPVNSARLLYNGCIRVLAFDDAFTDNKEADGHEMGSGQEEKGCRHLVINVVRVAGVSVEGLSAVIQSQLVSGRET